MKNKKIRTYLEQENLSQSVCHDIFKNKLRDTDDYGIKPYKKKNEDFVRKSDFFNKSKNDVFKKTDIIGLSTEDNEKISHKKNFQKEDNIKSLYNVKEPEFRFRIKQKKCIEEKEGKVPRKLPAYERFYNSVDFNNQGQLSEARQMKINTTYKDNDIFNTQNKVLSSNKGFNYESIYKKLETKGRKFEGKNSDKISNQDCSVLNTAITTKRQNDGNMKHIFGKNSFNFS